MLPVAPHRLLYRLSPPGLRARLKNRPPPGVTRFRLALPGGDHLLLDRPGQSKVLTRFAWKGIDGFEPDTIRLFHALARGARGVLDVGAYFGLYALVAARANPDAAVHAFEPLERNVALLRHLLALNRCERVSVHAVAVARRHGGATMYIPVRRLSALPATGSLRNCFAPGERFADARAEEVTVPTAPLDDVVEAAGLARVDLVKIDTEETECDVIASGVRTFERHRPDVVMEIIFGSAQAAGALARLRDLGYRFFHIERDGLVAFDERRPSHGKHAAGRETLDHCEIFCTPRGDGDLPAY